MTNTITLSNREMKINKVGEAFTEGAFEVVTPNGQVVFTAPTNKACVLFLAKNKTIKIEVAETVVEEVSQTIEIPQGQRFVVVNTFNEYQGLAVGMTVSTGKRTKSITAIEEVYTDQQTKEVWVSAVSPSGAISVVGINAAKKYKVLGK